VRASTELRISSVESSRRAHCLGTHTQVLPAACRCSRMQVLECSALQSIDDHHTKEIICLLPAAHCPPPTARWLHTHPCAARVPPLPSPAQVFIWACQTAVSASSAARCALTREDVPGAAALPSHHLPGTHLFLDTAAHEPQELCSNRRPRYGYSPALAPNRLAVAVSPLWPAPLVACQPCLMALGGAAEWTASRSPSCTHPLQ
jgi:hypothetical protein